ncbi:unnamed protein product, partial [Mesorhabditis belari]|uniref:Uncharacterized protein n=1 Tax=Mesorhabditis belari TaxID=2138241 RepID=A0AAF3FK78_9BILA
MKFVFLFFFIGLLFVEAQVETTEGTSTTTSHETTQGYWPPRLVQRRSSPCCPESCKNNCNDSGCKYWCKVDGNCC